MYKSKLFVILICMIFTSVGMSQTYSIQGFVFDDQNQRKLDEALIEVFRGDDLMLSSESDQGGIYNLSLEKGNYLINITRVAFNDSQIELNVSENVSNFNLGLSRLPGYEFDANVKELIINGKERSLGKELKNIRIEIFNNSSGKDVKVVLDDPKNTFKANFERNNHYTILIRKKGYFAKRVEAYVDIEGCILCFEGLGNDYAPEIESATTDKNQRGILIADIPMRKIVKDEAIRLDNIYYDFDKWNIRPDARPALDNLIKILKRNPIIIELSSHTDCRGNDEYNMELSQKRALSAVDYILRNGIKASRVTAMGYGETIPLNECIDGVSCTETEYQFNRRTEFKVTAIIESTNFDNKTLKQILEEEKINNKRSVEKVDDHE